MIELVLFVCLQGPVSPECKAEIVPYEGSPQACAIMGQMDAARWVSDHPKWRLIGWKCRPPEVDL